MTVTAVGYSGPTYVQIAGNSAAVAFSFPFLIFAATDLLVGFVTATGYSPQPSTSYSVSGVGNPGGGQVTFQTAPPTGTTVDIRSAVPQTQPTNFANFSAYYPQSTTNAVDRITRNVADMYRMTYLFGIHGPDNEATPWPALPSVATRANTNLGFGNTGLPQVQVALAQGTLSSTSIGQFLYGNQTTAEAAAGVNPTFNFYPPGNILRYGADPTGVADSTTAIQNAFNVCANGGPNVTVPIGTFTHSYLTVPSGVSMTGTNKATSVLNCSAATGNAITINASTSGLTIANLTIQAAVTRTSGATLYAVNSHNVRFSELVFNGVHATCILVDGGPLQFETFIDHIDWATPGSTIGIQLGLTAVVQDTFIDHVEISGCTDSGLKLVDCSGVYVNQASIFNCQNGVNFVPSTGTQVVEDAFFNTCLADTCTGSGWAFEPGTGTSVIGVYCTMCWGSSGTNAAGAGFFFGGTGQILSLSFSNCVAFNNAGAGWDFGVGAYITLNNCHAHANSQAGSASYPGLTVAGSITDLSIIGGIYGGIDLVANKQSVGIQLGTACDYITIIGANLNGNVTGGMSNASTGHNNRISNNSGYNPIQATAITVTASPFTYYNYTGAPVIVTINGGTVSAVQLPGPSSTPLTVAAATNTSVSVPVGQYVTVTYSAAPTMNFFGLS